MLLAIRNEGIVLPMSIFDRVYLSQVPNNDEYQGIRSNVISDVIPLVYYFSADEITSGLISPRPRLASIGSDNGRIF
jgi:hypothetical protein